MALWIGGALVSAMEKLKRGRSVARKGETMTQELSDETQAKLKKMHHEAVVTDWLGTVGREASSEAAKRAHCPYSNYHVGAAVLGDNGGVYIGCNVENASYGLTMCAERVAIFNAIVGGAKKIQAVYVTCQDSGSLDPVEMKMPCGACLQVIAELASDDIPIAIHGLGRFKLSELLPKPFQFKS
jgi:cytidine deaminase